MSVSEYGGHVSHGGDSAYLGLVTGQTSIGTSPTPIVTVSSNRSKLILVNMTTDINIFVSTSSGVSTSNGLCILPGTTLKIPHRGELYGIAGSSALLSFGEIKA